MIIGRYSALEIDGRTARIFAVRSSVSREGKVVHAELDDAPAVEIHLPLGRETATRRVVESFPDFSPFEQVRLISLLTELPDAADPRRREAAAGAAGGDR